MSTDRLFGVFDPAADEDVLVPLGAVDGLLPGRTKHECDRLRSAIELVYKTPKDCRWEHLGMAIRKFTAYKVSKDDLVKYPGPTVTHGVQRNLLLEALQVVVSVDQVLQVLAEFFNKREWDRFILHYDFAFLRLLASHTSQTEILATYCVLQHHTTVASKHLIQEINALMRMYRNDDQMSVGSYESTRASLRSIFGNGLARTEVGKLLARPEYFDKMPQDSTEIAAYLRGRAYKGSQAPKEPTAHRFRESFSHEKAESNSARNSVTPTMGQSFARTPVANEGLNVRFAMDPTVPSSISALLSKKHVVTRLPGAGRIGVSVVGASSERTMTSNNAAETIISSANNGSLRVPAASTTRIPSPKSWTSYVFQHSFNIGTIRRLLLQPKT